MVSERNTAARALKGCIIIKVERRDALLELNRTLQNNYNILLINDAVADCLVCQPGAEETNLTEDVSPRMRKIREFIIPIRRIDLPG